MSDDPRPVSMASVRKLKPNPHNTRTHSNKQISQIAESIRRFGWTYPLLVDEGNVIIAGHGRLLASKLLELRQVPIMVMPGLSDAEKRALALADNKIPANAGWDRATLAAELGELGVLLPECNLDTSITGFDTPEIDLLLGDLMDPEPDPTDQPVSLEKQAVSRRGDLWLLKDHRVLCGDARHPADYRKLLADERAAMVFTDPPYNVSIASVQGRGRIRHREFCAASGEMNSAEFQNFLAKALSNAARYSVDGAIHFVCMDWRHADHLSAVGRQIYSEQKNLIVWVKTNAGQGSFYRSQHELIFAFKNGEGAHVNNFELGQHGRSRSNVWTYAGVNTFRRGRMDELSLHPTVKPVALVADAIRDCSRRGDVILDPFLGSGTTILAAERVGRRGYGIELDPLYVDAAIRRWQDYTKRDAVLSGTRRTFEEVAERRRSNRRGTA